MLHLFSQAQENHTVLRFYSTMKQFFIILVTIFLVTADMEPENYYSRALPDFHPANVLGMKEDYRPQPPTSTEPPTTTPTSEPSTETPTVTTTESPQKYCKFVTEYGWYMNPCLGAFGDYTYELCDNGCREGWCMCCIGKVGCPKWDRKQTA